MTKPTPEDSGSPACRVTWKALFRPSPNLSLTHMNTSNTHLSFLRNTRGTSISLRSNSSKWELKFHLNSRTFHDQIFSCKIPGIQ